MGGRGGKIEKTTKTKLQSLKKHFAVNIELMNLQTAAHKNEGQERNVGQKEK